MSPCPCRPAHALLPITRKIPACWRSLLIVLLLVCSAELVCAAAAHRIVQKGRNFSLPEITISRGDSLLFTNDDEFLHQIYVDSPTMFFDSPEQPPGHTIEVSFPRAGTFAVRCHIHPKMLLTVYVQ